jgi:hypothetical protein
MQTDLTVVVFLLNQPAGFKDPFLDSMKVGAKVWKEFLLPATKEQSSLLEISWEVYMLIYTSSYVYVYK